MPIQGPLLPRLAASNLVIGPTPAVSDDAQEWRWDAQAPSRFVSIHTLHERFAEAVKAIGRPDILEWKMPWYQCTRHTGASHRVAAGGNIATLAAIMGHSTTWVTERCAHLRPDYDRLSGGSRLAPTLVSETTIKDDIRKE